MQEEMDHMYDEYCNYTFFKNRIMIILDLKIL